MNTPASQHVLQARDLIEQLQQHPEWAHVVLDFDQGENQCRAFIDRAVWSNGKIELKCLFDGELKTLREEELESDIEALQSDYVSVKALLERFTEEMKIISNSTMPGTVTDVLADLSIEVLEFLSKDT